MLLTFASTLEVTASSAASVSPDQGLFQRLIKIKYSSELYLIIKTKEAAKLNKPEMVDSALALYNTIRWNLDGLVYQLSGDLVAANSPKKYQQINQWCLNNFEGEAIAAVTSAAAAQSLKSIESLCAGLIYFICFRISCGLARRIWSKSSTMAIVFWLFRSLRPFNRV